MTCKEVNNVCRICVDLGVILRSNRFKEYYYRDVKFRYVAGVASSSIVKISASQNTLSSLRIINRPRLCYGNRLIYENLLQTLIEATLLTGNFEGEDALIFRIRMVSTDTARGWHDKHSSYYCIFRDVGFLVENYIRWSKSPQPFFLIRERR